MTVDDLARLICETQNVGGFKCTCPVPFEPDWCNGNRAKAQARAVVRALRDETRHMTLNRDGLEELFTQILGDAGEKVAGGSTREDGQSCNSSDGSSPATDAAPAVCEWKKSQLRLYEHSPAILYRTGCGADFFYNYKQCQGCGKPIAFTEANHG